MKKNQTGFAHLGLILIFIVIIGVVAFAATRAFGADPAKPTDAQTTQNQTAPTDETQQPQQEPATTQIQWTWIDGEWKSSATPPECETPLEFSQLPVENSLVAGILYPGQKRGGNYKPHGGFKLNISSNTADVRAIMDGFVTSGARYIEGGEVQYMFTIVNDCGIAYRYDHLLELSPAFQKLANSLPEPKADDSRTTDITKDNSVKAGDIIATAIGFKNTQNYTFDLGVYDYRTQNEAAKRGALDDTNLPDLSQSGHALCWLDLFPGASYRSLPAVDQQSGKTSDYCK